MCVCVCNNHPSVGWPVSCEPSGRWSLFLYVCDGYPSVFYLVCDVCVMVKYFHAQVSDMLSKAPRLHGESCPICGDALGDICSTQCDRGHPLRR